MEHAVDELTVRSKDDTLPRKGLVGIGVDTEDTVPEEDIAAGSEDTVALARSDCMGSLVAVLC
jgi:hypothetical protein